MRPSLRLVFLFVAVSANCCWSAADAEVSTVKRGRFSLSVDMVRLRLDLHDARTGRLWRSDEPALTVYADGTEFLARDWAFEQSAHGDSLVVRLKDFASGESHLPLEVNFEATLHEQGVTFALAPLQELPEGESLLIDFPRRFGMTEPEEEPGYLVLPVGTGGVRPFSRGPFAWETRVYANGSHGPNMAFLGKVLAPDLQEPGPAMLARVETPFDCRLTVETRDFTPRWEVWSRKLGGDSPAVLRTNYERVVDYRFLPSGRYVEVAKEYRRMLQAEGRFATIEERLPDQPELTSHIGAVIKKQYSGPLFDNGEIEAAQRLGLKNCVWFVGGWNYGGGDRLYPQRLPPNANRRSPDGVPGADGLRRTAESARAAGYVLSVHDNYSDAYKDSAEWDRDILAAVPDGNKLAGGVWNGGQAWIICPVKQLEFARRDMPRIREIVGRGGYFVDVTGAASPEPCFDPNHPIDRRRAAELKIELLSLAKKEFGVAYTEGIFDFLVPAADGCHKLFVPSGDAAKPHSDVVPVPLLPLVYHDAIVLWDLRREPPGRSLDPSLPKYVPPGPYEALYGCMPSTLGKASKQIAEKMASAQLAQMIDHTYLDVGVERTSFADGTTVIANFAADEFVHAGQTIGPANYLILQDE